MLTNISEYDVSCTRLAGFSEGGSFCLAVRPVHAIFMQLGKFSGDIGAIIIEDFKWTVG